MYNILISLSEADRILLEDNREKKATKLGISKMSIAEYVRYLIRADK